MTQEKRSATMYELEVKVHSLSSPNILELLANTVLGTPGKLRYKQKDMVERAKSHSNIEFIQIEKGSRLFGTVGVVKREVTTRDKENSTLYVRYLSIPQAYKRKSNSKSGNRKTEKRSALKQQILNKITDHFEKPFHEKNERAYFYAYVEKGNANSFNLSSSLGFKPVRTVETLLFSRFSPSKSKDIKPLKKDDETLVEENLRDFYKEHAFYFEDKLFETGRYFVKKMGGDIVAGIRANPVHWKIIEMPGIQGWLMRSVLPFLPYTNRLFHPNEFNFLAFDYAWHLPGKEHCIPELMSHCCTELGINTGLFWGDQESGITQCLKNSAQLGFLSSIQGTVEAHLMVRPINSSEDSHTFISERPVFVSSLDMT